MKIDKNLNMVIPVESDGVTYHIHSAPIMEETFDNYFMVIGQAFAKIYQSGMGIYAGPRIAAKTLEMVAREMNVWEGPAGVQLGLMEEIRRLTNVALPRSSGGWEVQPWSHARQSDFFSARDVSEVENIITFFILNSAMQTKKDLEETMAGAAKLWGGQITLLDCTAFAASLPTSTAESGTAPGEGAKPLSIPH